MPRTVAPALLLFLFGCNITWQDSHWCDYNTWGDDVLVKYNGAECADLCW